MDAKPTFLLSKAVIIPDAEAITTSTQKSNSIESERILIASRQLGTQSKTFAAPGDDDPDWGAEGCY